MLPNNRIAIIYYIYIDINQWYCIKCNGLNQSHVIDVRA